MSNNCSGCRKLRSDNNGFERRMKLKMRRGYLWSLILMSDGSERRTKMRRWLRTSNKNKTRLWTPKLKIGNGSERHAEIKTRLWTPKRRCDDGSERLTRIRLWTSNWGVTMMAPNAEANETWLWTLKRMLWLWTSKIKKINDLKGPKERAQWLWTPKLKMRLRTSIWEVMKTLNAKIENTTLNVKLRSDNDGSKRRTNMQWWL